MKTTRITSQSTNVDLKKENIGFQCDFSQIPEPGAWVGCIDGSLYRVPEDAIHPGRSPLVSIVCCNGTPVTKISSDPYVQITTARMKTADLDLPVNF
ncbi:MAG: hypothetical protein A2145_03270 [candidate division Zixibacteria bacterium RBG_16_40_9]|nr:MAG: hypothetical protein A2145_03270 [candidate division Zixibacteria bacterium RBG_16_40_9]